LFIVVACYKITIAVFVEESLLLLVIIVAWTTAGWCSARDFFALRGRLRCDSFLRGHFLSLKA